MEEQKTDEKLMRALNGLVDLTMMKILDVVRTAQEKNEVVNLKTIAERAGLGSSVVTRRVKDMIQRGLLVTFSEEDGREKTVKVGKNFLSIERILDGVIDSCGNEGLYIPERYWKQFERLVNLCLKSMGYETLFNQVLTGVSKSRRPVEIIATETGKAGQKIRYYVDAKFWKRTINEEDIASIERKFKDLRDPNNLVGAFLVTVKPVHNERKRLAQEKGITILDKETILTTIRKIKTDGTEEQKRLSSEEVVEVSTLTNNLNLTRA